jgi:hypothetical protein
MASVLMSPAHTAHSAAAEMLSAAQIEAGETIPQKPGKKEDPERSITLDLAGKNIIVFPYSYYYKHPYCGCYNCSEFLGRLHRRAAYRLPSTLQTTKGSKPRV